jgi:ribose 1,5-bisphosphokinase
MRTAAIKQPASDPLQSTGTMVVVVGPSGAGKDTLMSLAARHFAGRANVHFVRRVITRDVDAGGEDHQSVSEAEFECLDRAGAFAVSWGAHGLNYGIPAEVDRYLAEGRIVIANGSRSALDRFEAAFERVKVVNVTARADVLAERLEARGRETREEIVKRLARGSLTVKGDHDVTDIDNSGALEIAGGKLIALIETLTRGSQVKAEQALR